MTNITTVRLVSKYGRREIELGSYDLTERDWRVVGRAINIGLTEDECRRLLVSALRARLDKHRVLAPSQR